MSTTLTNTLVKTNFSTVAGDYTLTGTAEVNKDNQVVSIQNGAAKKDNAHFFSFNAALEERRNNPDSAPVKELRYSIYGATGEALDAVSSALNSLPANIITELTTSVASTEE